MNKDQLKNVSPQRVAWLPGGTQGIGAATAAMLVRDGWIVVVSGRGNGGLTQEDEQRWLLPTDVCSGVAVVAAAEALHEQFGRIDAAIVSVRDPVQGRFDTLTDRDWHAALDTKLVGFIRIARHVLPLLAATGGTLVSVVGASATVASATHPLGCVNAALRHVIRGLAMEWGPRGARVCGVSPGPVRTETLMKTLKQIATDRSVPMATVEAEVVRCTYRGRMLDAEEISSVIGLLLHPQSGSLNGTVIQADDGTVGGCL